MRHRNQTFGVAGLFLMTSAISVAGASCSQDVSDPTHKAVNAETTWELPSSVKGTNACGMKFASLEIRALDSDNNWLYVLVASTDPYALPAQVTPKIRVRQSGKDTSIEKSDTQGQISENEATWLAIQRAKLPMGQFDLTLQALGLETTVTLRNSGASATVVSYVPVDGRDELSWDGDSVGVSDSNSIVVEVK